MGDTGDDATRLVGREDEERRMRAVVGAARDGTGGAVLVTGEPGIGKTALLRSAVGEDDGAQVLRVDGYEAEATIPFAAVGRLIAPLQAHSPDLPARHQQALDTAAGLVDGPPPDPYLVGLGVLGLLAAAAEDSPVIGALDDLHWFDAESVGALAFVARRLRVEPVALLFTARDDDRIDVAHLHAALALFETTGAGIFSPRTAAELEASSRRGTRPAPIRSARPLALTPQEATVARLAAGGSTNAEIGATMFISVNTVDYHLRKVFQKLGISSRRQLRDRVGDGA